MMMKLIGSLSLCIWLAMAIPAALAQTAPILDTSGQPLERGVEYYIQPGFTDNGGRFTLIDRYSNGSCPLYVGQENVSGPEGFPVTFTPFEEDQTVVREIMDLKIIFSASTTCVQSTAWKLGETDEESQRRLIVTGEDEDEGLPGPVGNYFRINFETDFYSLQWCPTQVCPTCRFNCSQFGVLVENGKRLLALDGSDVLNVVFEKA